MNVGAAVSVFDPTPCMLGEGPLWHPEREQLFWFDIMGKRLLTRNADGTTRHWQFDEQVSAAGWVDADTLLIASETALSLFHLETGASEPLCALEADDPATRSNDGRADPLGGFWIGTMNKDGTAGGGAIYRFYKGELRKLFSPLSITNSICFAPGGEMAYFGDTPTHTIMRVALDAEGWPTGDPAVFCDLTEESLRPDGSVCDSEGNLWNAQWGSGRVACYAPDGTFLRALDVPAPQTTCPAFGGASLSTLFCTTAARGDDGPTAGQTFAIETDVTGLPEPRVILG